MVRATTRRSVRFHWGVQTRTPRSSSKTFCGSWQPSSYDRMSGKNWRNIGTSRRHSCELSSTSTLVRKYRTEPPPPLRMPTTPKYTVVSGRWSQITLYMAHARDQNGRQSITDGRSILTFGGGVSHATRGKNGLQGQKLIGQRYQVHNVLCTRQ